MFIKNLTYAFRNLWRDKFYTFLNGSGLAIGIAAALLIFLWANDEMSFDNFHSKKDRIHRVLAYWPFGGEHNLIPSTPYPFAEAAKTKVPEIEKITLVGRLWGTVIRHADKGFDIKNTKIVHADFFQIFDFPFLYGDANHALAQPNNVVLTKSMAEQIYGKADVVGQTLELVDKMEVTVSAVLDDIPSNSHLQFEMLIPFEGNVNKFYQAGELHWASLNYACYTLLRPGVEAEQVNKKLTALLPLDEERHEGGQTTLTLQKLSDVYLGSENIEYSQTPKGDWSSIRIIIAIGLLILLIACINYVNMTTARSAHRAKSTGVRKIIGASRWQLFNQYILEVLVLVAVSSIIALGVAHISLDLFEELSGKHFVDGQLFSYQTLSIFIATAFITIILAGIQPAIQLSSFNPINVLRGSGFKSISGKGNLRKVLVTTQFACSGALIICTLVMLVQMDFVKKQKLGYEREQIFSFRCQNADALVFKNELLGKPGVKAVTISTSSITDISNRYSGFDFEGKDKEKEPFLFRMSVEESFPDFFELDLKEGRWFLPGNRDSSSFILNETAITKLGIKDPIGKRMRFNGKEGSIVGVAKDFHFRSFHHEIEQLIFVQEFRWGMKRLYVKTTGETANDAIASVQKVFNQLEPDALLDYSFLDEAYDNLYKKEKTSSLLLGLFAGLAIFISCLGILGLAAYTAERRRKEIGIRKVLGASIANIILLLSKDFLVLVMAALVIAGPIAWYFMQGWLDNFAYRIDIEWWIFALAGLIAIGIAFITVSYQSLKAALSNPTESLRSE